MPTLFIFLFKVNIALLLFCAGYYLVLRHLTFYSLNRVYLVTAITFATLYPKIDLSDFAQKHETLTKPVQNVVLIWKAPAQKLATHTDYWQWAEVVFWAGAALLGFRLLVQLFSLFKLYRNSTPAHILNHDVRLMEGDAAPFSFWQSIYVNPANHTPADLKAILLHEQVHVNGWHTVDILLAELSSIFYWFNPGIWLMKKAVRENIEFITDRKILNRGFDTKAYQYSLVNVSFNNSTPGIVNHFNISTIKKRIIMMNAKRSSRVNLTRYAFVVPSVVVLLLVFTLSKAEATKPLGIKISNAIKPVTAAIKDAALTVVKSVKKDTTVRSVMFAVIKANPVNVSLQRDTNTRTTLFAKVDTGRKSTLIIQTSGSQTLDSLNFVIDGKKMSSADFKRLSPDKISAVNIVNYEKLDGILGPDHDYHYGNKRSIVFVSTNDSSDGKELMDRLEHFGQIGIKANGNVAGLLSTGVKGKLENVIITGYGSSLNSQATTINGKGLNHVTIVAGKPLATTINGQKPATLTLYNKLLATTDGKKNAIRVNDVVITGYGLKDGVDTVYVNGKASTIYKNPKVLTFTQNLKYTTDVPLKGVKISSMAYNVTNVNRISDKLIVIDGKEANEIEMKKLSAFDIDRMSVSSDADTIKKYGDKAKYGVVYIYTKKSK
jgi:bla regulator protein BlaR1